ncbi:MAG: hypothetical protein COB07_00395 [Sulfurovum sp.]|nr:MAG: hypothetical protein COB07_00395 [Sulfurovum sp.]
MTGKILGFDITNNTGTVSGDDGKRYKFSKVDWKESVAPQKETKVDFDMGEDGTAKEIYQITDKVAENNDALMGLLAIGITFFFGFIGTFVSRLVLAKQPIEKTIVPTLIHFVITMLALIPILGWIIYLIGTGYYMYKNYILVTTDSYALKNKYA